MKKIFILITIVSLLVSSCATVLAPRKQTLKIYNPKQNTVVFEKDTLGNAALLKTKTRKEFASKQVIVSKEGYMDSHQVVFESKKSFFRYLNYPCFITIFHLFFSSADLSNKKGRRFKNYTIKEPSVKLPEHKNDDKYIFIKTSSFTVKEENFKFNTITYGNFKKNNGKTYNTEKYDEDFKLENSIFTEKINDVLKENKLTDTSKNFFKSNTNSVYLKININSIDLNNVFFSPFPYAFEYDFYTTKLNLDIKLYDLYNNLIFKKNYIQNSGEYASVSRESVIEMMEDALKASVFKFIDEAREKTFLSIETNQTKIQKTIVKNSYSENSITNAQSATVTISRGKEKGHGSGCLISNDGYIVSNYHVVSGLKKDEKLTVLDNEQNEYTVKVIQVNPEYDLALLKAEGKFANHFKLPTKKNFTVGQDIFVLGTPKDIELGQSLSKGIISGIRKTPVTSYIQTDASVNGGNSGGALISVETKELIGIVNAKLVGFGIEGIGFAIPAHEVIKALGIVVK